MSTIDKVLLNADTNDKFIQEFMSTLARCNNHARSIPKGIDRDYAMMFSDFRESSDNIANEAADLIKTMLKFTDPSHQTDLPDDIADPYFYEQVSDTIDTLLRQANSLLDGKSDNIMSTISKSTISLNKARIIEGNIVEMPKPQLLFLHELDNRRNTPFRPKFKVKYHNKSNMPYPEHPISFGSDEEGGNSCGVYFPHPYEQELQLLSTSSFVTEQPTQIHPTFPDCTRRCTFIHEESELKTLIEKLQKSKEIAIDLEHHSYRSFLGLTCLMQLSTREEDFVLDTLALRSSLYQLGAVFANENIVKIFHGCEQDIQWLQRDCGLYIVNCFDTYIAAKLLEFPTLSLAHLCKFYCGVALDKKHQLSDWRVRPLPEEMMTYAKFDTHYLHYIYDRMRLDVWKTIGQDGLENILMFSKKLCLQRYEKPIFQPMGYKQHWNNFQREDTKDGKDENNEARYNEMQENAMSKLWNWRDEKGRVEDESVDYIMSVAELFRLATRLPRTLHEIESCAPLSAYVKVHINEILFLLQDVTTFGNSSANSSIHNDITSPARRGHSSRTNKSMDISTEETVTSIFQFTPAVIPKFSAMVAQQIQTPTATTTATSSTMTKNHAILPQESPEMTVNEMFGLAGWQTPNSLPEVERKAVPSSYSICFDSIQSNDWKEENKVRIDQSISDLLRSINSETTNLDVLINDLVEITTQGTSTHTSLSLHSSLTSSSASFLTASFPNNISSSLTITNQEMSTAAAMAEDIEATEGTNTESQPAGVPLVSSSTTSILPEIPQSLEDIYHLASKNRKKNKNKKRKSNVGNDGNTGSDGIDYEEYVYSAGKPGDTTTVDSTLAFAKEIGWLQNDQDMQEVKEEYQRVVAYQQSSEDTETSTNNNTAAPVTTSAKHNSNNTSNIANANATSSSSPKRPGKESTTSKAHPPLTSGSGKSSSSSANVAVAATGGAQKTHFDYTKLAHGAVGALPVEGSSSSGKGQLGGGSNKHSKGNNGGKNKGSKMMLPSPYEQR